MSLAVRAAVGFVGGLFTAACSIWGAFKFVEWAFGLATMPGNINETQSTLVAFMGWLLKQDPNLTVIVAVGCLFVLGLVMMGWAMRRTVAVSMAQPAALSQPVELAKSDKKRKTTLPIESIIFVRQFIAGPLTELHNGLVEIFFVAYNTIRGSAQPHVVLRLSHDLFERCIRDEFERVLAFAKLDSFDELAVRSTLMRYAQRFGDSTEVMNIVAETFNMLHSENPNLHIWRRGRDAIASEARKTSVYPGLGCMREIGERLQQEADRLKL